jgi:simple sugar transport system permease protein
VLATCQVLEFGSAAADRGLLKEFEAIIAVVIGGTLLTGGYGTVFGAALGAVIFGLVQQGLFFAGVESSLFRVFLGIALRGEVEHEELQNIMAGGQQLAELEGSLSGRV